MKKIIKKVKGILNPLKTYEIDGNIYYPSYYFNGIKLHKFIEESKIVIDNQSYYLEKYRKMKRLKPKKREMKRLKTEK